jgi:hypothetical protein
MKSGLYYTGEWKDGSGKFFISTTSEDFPSRLDRMEWFPLNAIYLRWELWHENVLLASQIAGLDIPKVIDSLAGTPLLVTKF